MGAIGTVCLDEDPAAAIQQERKKKRYGYLAWLCIGSHYLYLGRPFTQLLFWLTLGGLLLWWLADFFRLPAMIERHNQRSMEKLIARYRDALEGRLQHLESLNPAVFSRPPPAPLEAPSASHYVEPPSHEIEDLGAAAAGNRGTTAPALVLTGALGVAAALYIFNPPPAFPHSAESYRALRHVNVRNLPSTASPIRAVVAREKVLNGTVEAAPGGTAKWLRIDRGSHSGGYVAVQNLESL